MRKIRVILEADIGEDILACASTMISVAKMNHCEAVLDFNGIKLTAKDGDTPGEIAAYYRGVLEGQRS